MNGDFTGWHFCLDDVLSRRRKTVERSSCLRKSVSISNNVNAMIIDCFTKKCGSAQTFRDRAAAFVAAPTISKREDLTDCCEALTASAAQTLLQEVIAAYDGERIAWLQGENALAMLFDVGDLVDRLGDVSTLSPASRQRKRQHSIETRNVQHILHRSHSETLERRRHLELDVRRRNGELFDEMKKAGFSQCTDAKAKGLLLSTDDELLTHPPIWWADVPIQTCDSAVQRALVHRIQMLVRNRGKAAVPPATHAVLDESIRMLTHTFFPATGQGQESHKGHGSNYSSVHCNNEPGDSLTLSSWRRRRSKPLRHLMRRVNRLHDSKKHRQTPSIVWRWASWIFPMRLLN